MRLLVLGGTVFLGRHVVAQALTRGHEVSVFTRGLHGAGLFGEVQRLRGDRAGDLAALRGRTWDAVIDTSGREPAHVAASSRLLAGAVEHLVFVSSASAYARWPAEPVSEDSAVWSQGEDYGAKKAACERAAEAATPGRVAHVRAGLIVGSHDHVFRLPWWVARIARGGAVLAPGDPGRPLQLIDVRDLAVWMLDLSERRQPGVFNATSPPGSTTMRALLEAAVAATGSDACLTWVPDEALAAAGVEPWDGLPLWTPAADWPGTWAVDTTRAQGAGLRCRPIADTVADVWSWLREGGEAQLSDWSAAQRPTGLTPEREREILAAAA